MAEIKKIKVDGIEYDIGSNLGAELEWKLVATGTYDSKYPKEMQATYNLDKKLELNKHYFVKRYDDEMSTVAGCYIQVLIQENNGSITSIIQNMNVTDTESDGQIDGHLHYVSNDLVNEIVIDCSQPFYHSEGDTLEVYELVIKNVENPSNVVTPNKLNLYTTGTLYEEVQTDNTEIYYKLEKPLQPNKLYYVERYDAIMGMYFNCVIRTDYDALRKCTTKMLAGEDNCDTTIFANIAIIQSGEDDIPNLFYINGGEYSIYKDTEDTLEIYELPFEF